MIIKPGHHFLVVVQAGTRHSVVTIRQQGCRLVRSIPSSSALSSAPITCVEAVWQFSVASTNQHIFHGLIQINRFSALQENCSHWRGQHYKKTVHIGEAIVLQYYSYSQGYDDIFAKLKEINGSRGVYIFT